MNDIDELRASLKKKKKLPLLPEKKESRKQFLPFLLSKIMILTILFLSVLIYTKISEKNKLFLYKNIFDKNISFAFINNFYNKYLGGVLPFDKLFREPTKQVFKEILEYKETNIYKDGVCLTVDNKYLIPIQESGIIVFVGDKEGYGKTVIVQQVNGVDLWYGNVDNLNIKIYDYVEKGSLLGETIGNKLYLVYEKEGKFLDYKEFIK